jgi:FMN-dependent NADH-azoreductase
MSKLIYIQASPREDRSHSRAVADAFIDSYKKKNPDDVVDTVDLFKEDLPPFDGLALQAKYTILNGQKHTSEEKEAWAGIETIIERFKSADKYVFAVPMWNFGIPYRLKQYLDVIIQPGYTFAYSEDEGYSGLAGGKPTLVVYARGGEYPAGSDAEVMDFQKKYLDMALGFIGLTEVQSLIVEPTLMGGPEVAEEKRKAALKKATAVAENF